MGKGTESLECKCLKLRYADYHPPVVDHTHTNTHTHSKTRFFLSFSLFWFLLFLWVRSDSVSVFECVFCCRCTASLRKWKDCCNLGWVCVCVFVQQSKSQSEIGKTPTTKGEQNWKTPIGAVLILAQFWTRATPHRSHAITREGERERERERLGRVSTHTHTH